MNVKRIVQLLTNPQAYWNDAVGEPGDIRTLLVPQMLVLAAIPAVAVFLGTLLGLFTLPVYLGISGRLVAGAIVGLVLSYCLNIVVWILLGVVINTLAEPFGAQKDFGQAMKLATGAIIPMWLGSALHVTTISALGLLGGLAGLAYGAYLLYLGLPIMTGAPKERAAGYTGAAIGVTLVASIIVSVIVSCPLHCYSAAAYRLY